MNKAILIGIITSLFFVSFALAANDTNTSNDTNVSANVTTNTTVSNDTVNSTDNVTLDTPKILPSNAFWGLKVALENVRVALTFNKEKKAELQLQLAEERLAEIKAESDRGNVDAAAKAQARHDELLAKLETELNLSNNTTKSDVELRIEENFRKHEMKLEAVKMRILERLNNTTQDKKEKIQSLLDRLENETNRSHGLERAEERIQEHLNELNNSSKGLENALDRLKGNLDRDRQRQENRTHQNETENETEENNTTTNTTTNTTNSTV